MINEPVPMKIIDWKEFHERMQSLTIASMRKAIDEYHPLVTNKMRVKARKQLDDLELSQDTANETQTDNS